MKLICRSIGSLNVAPGSDRVLVAMPLPKGGAVESVTGEIHIIGGEGSSVNKFMAWGFSGHVVEILDPEESVEYNAIWDDIVSKAVDMTTLAGSSTVDINWDTLDGGPEIEPGEVDVNALLGMTHKDKELIPPRLEWISYAKSRQGGYVSETSATDTWTPSDYKTFRSRRKIRAAQPSAAMLAISSPSLTDTEVASSFKPPNTAGQWYMLQNIRDTIKEMGKAQAGLMEANDDLPFELATVMLQHHMLAPDMLDETTTQYLARTWTSQINCTWVIDLPGDSIPRTLDGR